MAAGRERLPNRRLNVAQRVVWHGRSLHVMVGYRDDGRPAEVFAKGPHEGSGTATILDEVCILISLALQHGVPADRIGGVISHRHGGDPETIVGMMIKTFCDLTGDAGDAGDFGQVR